MKNITADALPTSFRIVPEQAELTQRDPTTVRGDDRGRRRRDARGGARGLLDVTSTVQHHLHRLSLVLLVSSLFLIVNTIRLATFARRREIEVMKLVGASNWFVRVPFMAEGLVQGLIGAGLAVGVVVALKVGLRQLVRQPDRLLHPSST